MWCCVHAIFFFELVNSDQESFLVHENVYLINAIDEERLALKAKEIGLSHQDLGEDGHLELNGKKARYIFAGIRKIISVEGRFDDSRFAMPNGIEVSYSVFEVDTRRDVEALVDGKMVDVLYRE